jgi:hypothetical protein
MPIIKIKGHDVDVHDDYLKLSPADQEATRAEIEASLPKAEPKRVYSGSVLPFSEYDNGTVKFDSDAGVLGSLKRALTLPGDVMTGKVDPKSDEGIRRSVELAGVATPLGRGTGHLGLRKAEPEVPTPEQLFDSGGARFDAARDLGVVYSVPHVNQMAEGMRQSLLQKGILDKLAPKTHAIIDELTNPVAGATAPFDGLHAASKSFKLAGKDFQNPTEQLASGRANSALMDFLSRPPEGSVLAGPAEEVGSLVRKANGDWASASRSDKLQGIERDAENRAAASNSGQNTDNAIRGRIATLLKPENKKARAGFNKEELEGLHDVNHGTPVRNGARKLGNLLGGGGGLGQIAASGFGAAGAGMISHDPLVSFLGGAAAPAIGVASKGLANKLTQKALGRVDEATRMRSPLYEEMVANAPNEATRKREALAKALMMGRMQPDATSN